MGPRRATADMDSKVIGRDILFQNSVCLMGLQPDVLSRAPSRRCSPELLHEWPQLLNQITDDN